MQFNGLDLKIISSEEYEEDLKNINDIPVWIDPISIRIYENKEIIKILLDNEPLAYYVVPFYYKDGKKWAERKYRYFAYLSPYFVKKCPNKKRKEAIYLIFNYIFSNYDYMYMPLHPSFTEISAIQGMGAFMESRHTHVLRNVMNLDELDSKLRNNIKSASKKLKITIDNSVITYIHPDNSTKVVFSKDECYYLGFELNTLYLPVTNKGFNISIEATINSYTN